MDEFKRTTAQFRSETRRSLDELKKTMWVFKTEVVNLFDHYTQINKERVPAIKAEVENGTESASVEKRLAIVESRLTEVERRLHLPPAA